jgi:hypothetical protein
MTLPKVMTDADEGEPHGQRDLRADACSDLA